MAKQQKPKMTKQSAPYKIGQAYFVRTVTMHLTGRIVAVHPQELVMEDAAWIADSGRFATALRTGALSEVEPIGTVIIGRGSIVDVSEWRHALPKEQK